MLVEKWVKVRSLFKRIRVEELEFCYKVKQRNRAVPRRTIGVKRSNALCFVFILMREITWLYTG